ncbi:MAG: hypothetical protein KJ822_17920 [Proteobacteria bacterium]|nr:hypothetical protein [Pseudomonadota bacterium]
MHFLRRLSVLICLVLSYMVLVSGAAFAQGGGKSLQELRSQAEKIKFRETTEAEVISLMGQPAKTEEDIKTYGGGVLRERKILSYGPSDDIVIVIMKSDGKVYNVKYGGQP